jgi:hypothetical protein
MVVIADAAPQASVHTAPSAVHVCVEPTVMFPSPKLIPDPPPPLELPEPPPSPIGPPPSGVLLQPEFQPIRPAHTTTMTDATLRAVCMQTLPLSEKQLGFPVACCLCQRRRDPAN